ncbi:MAG: nickel-dependent lactate racemase [Bryobacteraceae bacterium]
MRVQFAFGKTGLEAELPPGPEWKILEPRYAEPLEDERAAIEQALDAPVAGPPLEELARGGKSAAISVCDITRPAPNRLTLPPLLERLHRAGIPPERIRILIATGLHRPATPAEVEEILGPGIAGAYPVVNHNARQRADHVYLGQASRGTPVWIDRRYVEADLHITLGFIEQHLMAGFSGGRKLIAPGLAGEETIRHLHSPRFMREPKAVEGSLEQNPLHEELLEIAKMAGHEFIVDVVLGRGRKITAVFAGEPRAAHAAGVAFVREKTTAWIPAPVEAAVTTAAGYPLDLTFYQAVKGVTAASHIVRPGGIILVLAACEEGAGAGEFSRLLMESSSAETFLTEIAQKPVTIDQWQLEKLALTACSHRVWYYTPGLPAEYHPKLWGRSFPTAAAALEALAGAAPAGAPVAVIPEGPYVFARVGEPAVAPAGR